MTCGTFEPVFGIDQQGGKGQANYAEDISPTILSDSPGTPHAVAYGITAKGNGDCFINADTHTSLSHGGGMPGQGYGAVLVVDDQGGNQIEVEKEEISPTLRAQSHGHEPLVFENHGQDTRFKESEVSQTVTATFGMGGNNTPFVVEEK